MNSELPPETTDGRTAVFDLRCRDRDGSIFIVEMQNCDQPYIYERGLYYICRAIASQDKVGDKWKFNIVPVYGIFFLNFASGKTNKVRTDIVLFPLFDKTEQDCATPLDYWLYNLKHMEQLESLPFKGQKALFQRLEELARIVNMNKKERDEYEACLKVYRDQYNTWNYMKERALEEGREKGREEGRAEGRIEGISEGFEKGKKDVAHKMKQSGMSLEVIAQCTGLSIEEIEQLD